MVRASLHHTVNAGTMGVPLFLLWQGAAWPWGNSVGRDTHLYGALSFLFAKIIFYAPTIKIGEKL